MSYCTDCIHYKVCGNEGVDDSAMTFCADKQTDGDLISRQAVLDLFNKSDEYSWEMSLLRRKIEKLPPVIEADEVANAVAKGKPLDLEGLKSDMKALNCGFPYGLDYLLDCLDKRLGITITGKYSERRGEE